MCLSPDTSLLSDWSVAGVVDLDWSGMFTSNSSLVYELSIGRKQFVLMNIFFEIFLTVSMV